MKAFLWSLSVHIVLVGLLTYHHFEPGAAAKNNAEPPILAYAYQPVKAKPAPPVVVPVPVKAAAPEPVVKTVKEPQSKKQQTRAKPAALKAKTTTAKAEQPKRKPFVPVRKPAMVKPLPKPIPKQPEVMVVKPIQVPAEAVSAFLDQQKSTANKALQVAKQGKVSGSASWKEKQQQLALEITAAKAEKKPEMGRKVKTFADGSSLIDTHPGCWKVPPPESRKDAMWLSTSVPCKADTTVEQIDAILQKRRSYSRD